MAIDDDFFGRVGHDLRGELATMLAGVHYLLRYETSVGATGRDMLERVNGAGQRLKKLLGEFDNAIWLDASQKRDLPVEPYELDKLCAAAVERVAHVAVSRGVSPVCDVAPGITLRGTAEILTIGLEYVFELAILRSRDSSVTVRGRLENGQGRVTVIDAGPAVEPERLAHLVEPFAEKEIIPRDDASSKRRERLGLGLAIAKGIFESHGGGLTVQASGARGLAIHCNLGG